jgi:hypothetical protein
MNLKESQCYANYCFEFSSFKLFYLHFVKAVTAGSSQISYEGKTILVLYNITKRENERRGIQ